MPHLIIEYAAPLAADEKVLALLDAVYEAALATALFPADHIRTRAIPVVFYRTGEASSPDSATFIHAQLRIKEGRSEAQKKALSRAVLAAIKRQQWPAQVITVEVVDMDTASYAKSVAEVIA